MKPTSAYKMIIVCTVFIFVDLTSFSQGKLIANGATINVTNSAFITTYDLSVNGSSTLNITNSTLKVADSIQSNANINLRNGTLEMYGGNGQSIPAASFQNNAVNNLIVSNTNPAGVSIGGPLDIYNSLTYSGTGKILYTNDNLTFKSTADATAWLGDMTGNTISGKATVERYVAARKAWRFLSIPTNTTQTVRETWQEGAASSSSNPVPGFGTQITGAGGTAAGFDLYSPMPSVKTYNSSTNTWVGISSTTNTIKAADGYMVFIRGDRMVTSISAPATATVLRTKGNLYTGDQTPITVSAGKFTSIGNPYPSAIDMRNIIKTGVKDFFYVWDPALAGTYGYGTYQTFSNNGSGNYVITPGGGSYGTISSISNYIASGLAFFVQGDTSTGSITLRESAKTGGSGISSAPASLPYPKLMGTLYGVNADSTTYVADGFLVNYKDCFSNTVDDNDAVKLMNPSENLAIKRDNILLVIERRHSITSNDSVFLNLTNLKVQRYRFEFTTDQLYQQGFTGYVQDAYLHTSTPLNIDGTILVDFTITSDAASKTPGRFMIVFSPLGTLPVTFTSVNAYPLNSNINVVWKADNASDIKQYEVEKSVNGNDFAVANTIAANRTASGNYHWLDTHVSQGNNYYRIISTAFNGERGYSPIVKVFIGKENQQISVYPNPVTGDVINLLFGGQSPGLYEVLLLNAAGQVLLSKEINHKEGIDTEKIPLGKLSVHGVYQLEIAKPGGNKINMNVVY